MTLVRDTATDPRVRERRGWRQVVDGKGGGSWAHIAGRVLVVWMVTYVEACLRIEKCNEGLYLHDVAMNVKPLPSRLIHSLAELDEFEAEALANGFEGVMLRPAAHSVYKYGRSTLNEGLLLKVKRFTHAEAKIIGYEELMNNLNPEFKDELGRTKRTSHKDYLVRSGMIGSYIVSSPQWDKPFKVSCSAMSHAEKKERFRMFNLDLGKTIRFKYLAHGMKDVPRHGVYDGFRAEEDAEALA